LHFPSSIPGRTLLGPLSGIWEARHTFTDTRLAAAVVDRLTFNAHIIQTGTNSYRLTSTRTKKGAAANT
jgi:hypothetical protein